MIRLLAALALLLLTTTTATAAELQPTPDLCGYQLRAPDETSWWCVMGPVPTIEAIGPPELVATDVLPNDESPLGPHVVNATGPWVLVLIDGIVVAERGVYLPLVGARVPQLAIAEQGGP
jgi:hypothetical protein